MAIINLSVLFFVFHFICNFLLTKIFIKKIVYLKVCFTNYIIFCSLLILAFFKYKISFNELIILFYFLSIFSLIYLQFFYGFVTGMSSDLIFIFYSKKLNKQQIMKLFENKNKDSKIILKRINFLISNGYIIEKKKRLYLTKKAVLFKKFYSLICYYLNVKNYGGIKR